MTLQPTSLRELGHLTVETSAPVLGLGDWIEGDTITEAGNTRGEWGVPWSPNGEDSGLSLPWPEFSPWWGN